jgi:hypothetical protein
MIELDWDTRLTVFKQCGIVQASDSEILLDKAEWDAVGETANLIEELRIVELEPLVPLLREIRDRRVAD